MKEKVENRSLSAQSQKTIRLNLKLVEKGKPLSVPLAVLNGEFKKAYKKKVGAFALGSVPHPLHESYERICILCRAKFKSWKSNGKVCKKCRPVYHKKLKKEANKRYWRKMGILGRRKYQKERYEREKLRRRLS